MKQIVIEFLNSLYDLKNFYKYSFNIDRIKDRRHYNAYLTKLYHTVEKGLALPSIKLGFGADKISQLIKLTSQYINQYGEDLLTSNISSVLNEYVIFHKKMEFDSPLIEAIDTFLLGKHIDTTLGGVKKYVPSNISKEQFELFFKSRTSVRNYKDIVISEEIILKAIDVAKFTPSVCNRQGWRVHIFTGERALEMLSLQNGNRGFTNTVKTVAIITGDITSFSANERNQINIDSGMFSMSFIMSLYSLGVSTCALNTCVSLKSENKIKRIGGIPESQKVIMYMSLGYASDDCYVAKSSRMQSESFVTFH